MIFHSFVTREFWATKSLKTFGVLARSAAERLKKESMAPSSESTGATVVAHDGLVLCFLAGFVWCDGWVVVTSDVLVGEMVDKL